MSTELAKRETIAELVRTWDECSETIRRCFLELDAAQERLEQAFAGPGRHFSLDDILRRQSLAHPERAIDQLEQQAWAALFDALEVRQFLSVEATRKLDQQLEGRGEPLGRITLETVLATLQGLHRSIPVFAAEAVREVFDFLRPPRSRLKTNKPWHVGRKVILPCYCEAAQPRWPWRPSVNFHCIDRLRALDRVFHLLDGKGYISKSYGGELVDAICATSGEQPEGQTEYFAFRVYRNGNLHVTFRRPNLVAELNRIAGGKEFKPKEAA